MALGASVSVVADVERQLAALRGAGRGEPLQRTSVLTHLAWLPHGWVEAGRKTLAGLGERHPSRTILLLPQPDASRDGIDSSVSYERFRLPGGEGQVGTEVIELRLRGARAQAPASVVVPLLIFDLPVFLRWRGALPFGAVELEQLVDVADRLVVDSTEWPKPAERLVQLGAYFERGAVSDIAWSRTLHHRRALADRWPGIGTVEKLQVRGPEAEALLLAGWLRSRLGRDVALAWKRADRLVSVAADGEEIRAEPDPRTPSDLLSEELDSLARDRVYEAAVTAAVSGTV